MFTRIENSKQECNARVLKPKSKMIFDEAKDVAFLNARRKSKASSFTKIKRSML
jgi:hypothetical protein